MLKMLQVHISGLIDLSSRRSLLNCHLVREPSLAALSETAHPITLSLPNSFLAFSPNIRQILLIRVAYCSLECKLNEGFSSVVLCCVPST